MGSSNQTISCGNVRFCGSLFGMKGQSCMGRRRRDRHDGGFLDVILIWLLMIFFLMIQERKNFLGSFWVSLRFLLSWLGWDSQQMR